MIDYYKKYKKYKKKYSILLIIYTQNINIESKNVESKNVESKNGKNINVESKNVESKNVESKNVESKNIENIINIINKEYDKIKNNSNFIWFKDCLNFKLKTFTNIYDGEKSLNIFIDMYMNDLERLKTYIWTDMLNSFTDNIYVKLLLVNLYYNYIDTKDKLIKLTKKEIEYLVQNYT